MNINPNLTNPSIYDVPMDAATSKDISGAGLEKKDPIPPPSAKPPKPVKPPKPATTKATAAAQNLASASQDSASEALPKNSIHHGSAAPSSAKAGTIASSTLGNNGGNKANQSVAYSSVQSVEEEDPEMRARFGIEKRDTRPDIPTSSSSYLDVGTPTGSSQVKENNVILINIYVKREFKERKTGADLKRIYLSVPSNKLEQCIKNTKLILKTEQNLVTVNALKAQLSDLLAMQEGKSTAIAQYEQVLNPKMKDKIELYQEKNNFF